MWSFGILVLKCGIMALVVLKCGILAIVSSRTGGGEILDLMVQPHEELLLCYMASCKKMERAPTVLKSSEVNNIRLWNCFGLLVEFE